MKTQIKILGGHLTAFDKRAILQILNAGATQAKSPKKTWRIESDTVWITEPVMEWSGMRTATYKAQFQAI